MHYVYFLLLKNGNIYKGMSKRLKKRLREHKYGSVKSTRHYRPIQLIGYEAYRFKSDAERRERFLKTSQGRKLLKQQYRDVIKDLNKEKDLV